jgi:hypothetical integral membrane protein (TIGR02206 family)
VRDDAPAVRQLSPEHIAALVVTAVAAVWAARRPRSAAVARALALFMAAAFVAEQIAYLAVAEWSAQLNLPLQLTDAVTFVSIAVLWRARPLLVELLWFWALTASLQATLTPDLAQPFPDVRYFTYFAVHGGALVAVALVVVGRRELPRAGGMWRAYAATFAWAVLAALGDVVTGGNYMFLRHKPETASLLDLMGPWPVYIGVAALFALGLFALLEALGGALRRSSRG